MSQQCEWRIVHALGSAELEEYSTLGETKRFPLHMGAAERSCSVLTYLWVINGGILYHPPPLWLRVQERPVPAEANLPYGERPIALRPSTCDE